MAENCNLHPPGGDVPLNIFLCSSGYRDSIQDDYPTVNVEKTGECYKGKVINKNR